MKPVIMFDLDGTLVDSVGDLTAGLNQMLALHQTAPVDAAQVRNWVGNGMPKLVERALRATGLDIPVTTALPQFEAAYAQCQDGTCLYPGVADVIPELARSHTLVVVTNKPMQFIPAILARFGLTEYFTLVLGGDSLPGRKPDPMQLNYALEQCECPAEWAWMVGDSRNDIRAAQAAGVRSIGLTYGYNYGEDIALAQPDRICDHFADIPAVITTASLCEQE